MDEILERAPREKLSEQELNFRIRDAIRGAIETQDFAAFIELVDLLEINLTPHIDDTYRGEITEIEEREEQALKKGQSTNPFSAPFDTTSNMIAYEHAKKKYAALIKLMARKGLTGAYEVSDEV